MSRIKSNHLAGTWYPGAAHRLRAELAEFLRVQAPLDGPGAIAVVVPHAGYQYSGRAAAAAYRCLEGRAVRRVVILAPSHFHGFRGVALLDVDAFETPLGAVRVDREGVAALAAAPLFAVDAAPFQPEHSLEIQLPFLQMVLPEAAVVPALLGQLSGSDRAPVARALDLVVDEDTVVVVSSDFTHYGWRFDYQPFPATDAAQVRAGLRELDMGAIDRVCAGDAQAFDDYVVGHGVTICGHVPISVFLTWHRGRTRGRLLSYYTSLDVVGDYEHSVSYASIAFPRP